MISRYCEINKLSLNHSKEAFSYHWNWFYAAVSRNYWVLSFLKSKILCEISFPWEDQKKQSTKTKSVKLFLFESHWDLKPDWVPCSAKQKSHHNYQTTYVFVCGRKRFLISWMVKAEGDFDTTKILPIYDNCVIIFSHVPFPAQSTR